MPVNVGSILLATVLIVNINCDFINAVPGSAKSQFWTTSSTTLATFNTALIPVYPELKTRTDIIIQKILAESDVDIWCLQEVFFGNVHRKIYNAVKQHYPYVLSNGLTAESVENKLSTGSRAACSLEMLQSFGTCKQQALQTTCAEVPERDRNGCAIQSCTTDIQSDSCRQCVESVLAGGDIAIASHCASDSAVGRMRNKKPTYGLLMLSKYELTETKVEGFTPKSQFRGFMQATVQNVGNLICAHLSAFLGDIYLGPPITFPPLYKSYDEQQYTEVLRLFDVLMDLEEPILLGDFNHGPALSGNITWELPFHYGLMTSHGLVSPYVLLNGRCTWCGSEENSAASSVPYDQVIDHIYIPTESFERIENVERILDGFTTPSGLPISDHYGVKVTLTDYVRDCSWWNYRYFCKPEPTDLMKLPPPEKELSRLCKAVV